MTPRPEEPPEEGPGEENPGGPPERADAALRGWIDPDDRLWRHPSELAAGALPSVQVRPHGGRHPRIMILIGAAAALAAVAWTIVLLSPASDQPVQTPGSDSGPDIPLTTVAVHGRAIPVAAVAAGHSMVQLRAVTTHGVVSLIGVAVAEGGLVATTADGLAGLRSILMVGPNGRTHPATVVGVDGSSDLALVSVPDDVPVAPFADDGGLTDGSTDMTLSMVASGNGVLTLHCTPGSVTTIGAVLASGWAKGMPGITSSAPTAGSEPGDPLLNQAGDVVGILYGAAPTPAFLPSQLVLGVTDDLRSTGRVSHGWLGVQGATAPGSGGALVATLMSGSPADGLLHPGDVVVAVDSEPVRSMADLRARLYVLSPNVTVGLSVVEGSTTRVVDVKLGASP